MQRSDSPCNSKIQYERNFLLQFRTMFVETPPGLEDFHRNFHGPSSPSSAPPSPTHQDSAKKVHSNCNTPRHRVTSPSNAAHVTFQPPQLDNRAENAFSNRKETQADSAILQHICGMLNKITPEKYDTLVSGLKSTSVLDDHELMEKVILMIFEKAIWEPEFACMYADLCSDMSHAEMDRRRLEGGKTGSRNSMFRRLLLQQCQREFERRELDKPPDGISDEAWISKQRRRKTGNMKFVGELFKKGMLTEKIIQQVVMTLLFGDPPEQERYEPPEWDVDILASLFGTVGQLIDTQTNHAFLDSCFRRMKHLAENARYPPRSRFILMDTIELRQNSWAPRKQALKAVKLQELERQVAEAELEKAAALHFGRPLSRSGATPTNTVRSPISRSPLSPQPPASPSPPPPVPSPEKTEKSEKAEKSEKPEEPPLGIYVERKRKPKVPPVVT
eukprot:TRINITY_DN989_c0_g1_i1.p1 TRINITY_DN989_c0_g1~~TRINITY_DN989_c0_g1_i1.p1  ORF type:complete len:446 (-),score=70.66 TRINITY_DN989_c0_g1_i1:106-1443(-)